MNPEPGGEDVRILRVEDAMRRENAVIEGKAPIAEAIASMKRARTPCLIVAARWDGDAYGLLTARDLVVKAVGAGPARMNFSEHSVAEVMEKPAVVVGPGLELKYAVRLMAKPGIPGLLVTKDGSPIGTLTLEDVFAAL